MKLTFAVLFLAVSALGQYAVQAPAASSVPAPRVVVYGNESWIGVGLADLTADTEKSLKLKSLNGAEVVSVDPTGAGGRAGLKAEDVIVSFNGQPVIGVKELQRLISETPAGRQAPVEIVRDGKSETVQVELDSRGMKAMSLTSMAGAMTKTTPNALSARSLLGQATAEMAASPAAATALKSDVEALRQAVAAYDDAVSTHTSGDATTMQALHRQQQLVDQLRSELLAVERQGHPQAAGKPTTLAQYSTSMDGMDVEALTPQLASYFGLKEGQAGLLVRSVKSDSSAATGGLQAGDVVTAVNGKAIATGLGGTSIFRSHAGEEMRIEILRKGSPMTLTVKAPELGPVQGLNYYEMPFGDAPFAVLGGGR